jgi:DNA polymerase-1
VHAADELLQQEGIRQAGNAPIQMGAQGVIKRAMGLLQPQLREWRSQGIWIWPLLQIHDDLLFEVQDDAVDIVAPVIKRIMETAVTLSVPIHVDQKFGPRWGSMGKIKEG